MNKRIINIIIGILIVIALPVAYLIGYNSFKVTNSVHNINNKLQHKNNYIDKEKVKELVLNHSKVSEDNIRDYSVELDVEHNKVIYEVSFDVDNLEYEYELDAVTGEILLSYKEIDKDYIITTTKKVTTTKKITTTKKTTDNKISKSKAKSIALKHAKLKSSDIREYEIELDYEGKKYIYEIDFESGKYDYSYDIDAITGKIINSKKELED